MLEEYPNPYFPSLLAILEEKSDSHKLEENLKKLSYFEGSMPHHHLEEPIEIAIFPKSFVMKDYYKSSTLPKDAMLYQCYLLHELYHMKDLKVENGTILIGFTTIQNHFYHGLGLNEGCTEFFVMQDLEIEKRKLSNPSLDSYIKRNGVETMVASMICDVMGEPYLRRLQENHDIDTFLYQLGLHSSTKKVDALVDLLDKIHTQRINPLKDKKTATKEVLESISILLEMGATVEGKDKILTKMIKK